MPTVNDILKRAMDVSFAAIGLVIASPVLLVVAGLVKVASPGPILFRQERVGRHGIHFKILKFRTMVPEAESLGPQVTAASDARITPIGKVLRRTKLDELPQLFNVLSGSMSLVGPRPEVPKYVQKFQDEYREILEVRPGITDEASIVYRDEEVLLAKAKDPVHEYATVILPQKIKLYRRYVKNRSVWLDLKILVRTLRVILGR